MKDKKSAIFGTVAFGAMILIIWSFHIYYKTFVPLFVPIGMGVLAGVISTIFMKKTLERYFPTTSLLSQFVYNTITWGGYIVFFFLWMNIRYADIAETKVTEKIISTGYLTGRRGESPTPYILIHFDGRDKQVVYDDDTLIDFEHVDLSIAKGLFGYYVIRTSHLY